MVSKIYIATDSNPVDDRGYELCSDMIDVVFDVSCIYGYVVAVGCWWRVLPLCRDSAGINRRCRLTAAVFVYDRAWGTCVVYLPAKRTRLRGTAPTPRQPVRFTCREARTTAWCCISERCPGTCSGVDRLAVQGGDRSVLATVTAPFGTFLQLPGVGVFGSLRELRSKR